MNNVAFCEQGLQPLSRNRAQPGTLWEMPLGLEGFNQIFFFSIFCPFPLEECKKGQASKRNTARRKPPVEIHIAATFRNRSRFSEALRVHHSRRLASATQRGVSQRRNPCRKNIQESRQLLGSASCASRQASKRNTARRKLKSKSMSQKRSGIQAASRKHLVRITAAGEQA